MPKKINSTVLFLMHKQVLLMFALVHYATAQKRETVSCDRAETANIIYYRFYDSFIHDSYYLDLLSSSLLHPIRDSCIVSD